MNIVLLLIVAVILGALGRRIAGGLLAQWIGKNTGSQPVRVLWGATAGLTVLLCGLSWLYALYALVAIWAGSCLFGYGPPGDKNPTAMNMGHPNGMSPISSMAAFWKDFGWMTYHGVGGILILAIGAGLAHLSWWWIVLAGLMCAPLYALAYVLKPNVPVLGLLNMPEKGLVDPCPTGEMLWGGVVGAGIVLSILC